MAEVKVDPPPLKTPVADLRTGMPTKSLTDFLYRLWRRTGGNTDRASELQAANEQVESLAQSGLSLAEQSQQLAQQNQEYAEQIESQAGQAQEDANSGLSLSQQAFGLAQEALTLAKLGQTPIGGVMPFTGSLGDIPENWALCNGSNGTPDLRDMFILGAGGDYAPGSTGGEREVALNITQMPNHDHDASLTPAPDHSHPVPVYSGSPGGTGAPARGGSEDGTVGAKPAGGHGHQVTIGKAGGGQPHENMPPFYALALIVRIE